MSPGTRSFVRPRIDVTLAVGGMALLAICAFVVRDARVSGPEQAAFEAINHLPDALDPVMNAAQLLGVLLIGPVVAVGALVLRRWRLAAAALIVTAGKLGAERIVWQVVQRDRPGVTEPNAVVCGSTPASGISFVSGHVVLTVALAWVITPYLRGRWKAAPWAVVAVVGVARIYLGAHNPLDVLGGLGLGLAIGAAANLIVGRPAPEPRGPGPSAPAVRGS